MTALRFSRASALVWASSFVAGVETRVGQKPFALADKESEGRPCRVRPQTPALRSGLVGMTASPLSKALLRRFLSDAAPIRHSQPVEISSLTLPPLLHGVRNSLALPAWVVGLTMIGIGGLARDVGVPAGAAVLSTVLIWAGPAQVILFGGLSAGVAWPAIAIAVCLSSIRLLPMTISVLPLLRLSRGGASLHLLAAHFVAVTVWVESLARLPSMPPERRRAYYFGFAGATVAVSTVLTLLGHVLAGTLPLQLSAAILFLTPIFFTVSLVAAAKRPADWTALALGFGLSPIFGALLGRDFDLLATGIAGGTAAYLVGRMQRLAR
jgi:predicted branched-subunit amino acid permease